ncbi:unnamed protein product [Calypogeia fissa]
MGSDTDLETVLDDKRDVDAAEDEEDEVTKDGTVDTYGKPASRKNSGGWKAARFILALQVFTNIAFFGIANNLVIFLTTVMHAGNASAAKNVSNWNGTGYVTPLIAAFVADAFWGRYWTAFASCLVYIVGTVLLTLSASLPSLRPQQCSSKDVTCEHSSVAQASFLYMGLYMLDVGAGGVYGTITALGGDQFDEGHEKERKQKSSFFNWFYQSIFTGSLIASTFSVYIQDNVSWGWGWGISNVALVVATGFLILGAPWYRYHKPRRNPLTRISQVLVAAFRKRQVELVESKNLHEEAQQQEQLHSTVDSKTPKIEHSDKFKVLDKSATDEDKGRDGIVENRQQLCILVTQVEEVKFVIRVLPIWLSSIMYSTVYSQISTLFIMQGASMNLKMGSIRIPPASLSVFESSSVILWVVIYDRLLVPLLKRYTGNQRGISALQRIGIGLALSIVAMIVAAIVEVHRLRLVREYNLLDDTHTPVPMTVFWEIPQYILMGASEVFTYIGLIEFFYDQAPPPIRSMGSALSMVGVALGNFFSSCLVTMVNRIAKRAKGGYKSGWIADNLNRGRIDLFYTLLAVLSFVNLVAFVICANHYKENKSDFTLGQGLKSNDDEVVGTVVAEENVKDVEIIQIENIP